ncbi:hypothetical protein IW262DRAFT_562829 [Armillaria fumosa]|nr:hypothetical protein IW262DRAFT_562829 [Armillaria fumosa]
MHLTGTRCILPAWRAIYCGPTKSLSIWMSLLSYLRHATPIFVSAKRNLVEYYSSLRSVDLTNCVLSCMLLPRSLDPNLLTPLPNRLTVLPILLRDTLTCLSRLSFFLYLLSFIYLCMSWAGLGHIWSWMRKRLKPRTRSCLAYPAAFLFLWAFL